MESKGKTLDLLAMEAKSGNQNAKEELVKRLFAKACKVAGEFVCKLSESESLFEDYRNEALLGVLKCLDSYDFSKGSFLRYSDYAMRVGIRDFINKNQRMITQPKNVTEKVSKYLKACKRLADKGCVKPTDDEIINEIGFSNVMLRNTKRGLSSFAVLSLDQPLSAQDEKSVIEVVPGDEFEDALIQRIQMDFIRDKIKTFDEKYRMILLSQFGAMGYVRKSSRELGKMYGVSATTINNYRNNISKQLRSMFYVTNT